MDLPGNRALLLDHITSDITILSEFVLPECSRSGLHSHSLVDAKLLSVYWANERFTLE